MTIESQIAKINRSLEQKLQEVFSGLSPGMKELEDDIQHFIELAQTLPQEQRQEYSHILQVWAVEIKKMSDKLDETKQGLESEISKAQNQNRGVSAYASSNALKNNNGE